MFLTLPGHSEVTNQQISPSSTTCCPQISLGGPGTYLTLDIDDRNRDPLAHLTEIGHPVDGFLLQ